MGTVPYERDKLVWTDCYKRTTTTPRKTRSVFQGCFCAHTKTRTRNYNTSSASWKGENCLEGWFIWRQPGRASWFLLRGERGQEFLVGSLGFFPPPVVVVRGTDLDQRRRHVEPVLVRSGDEINSSCFRQIGHDWREIFGGLRGIIDGNLMGQLVPMGGENHPEMHSILSTYWYIEPDLSIITDWIMCFG